VCKVPQKIHSLVQSNANKIASLSISYLELQDQCILGVYFSHSTLDEKQQKIELPLYRSSMARMVCSTSTGSEQSRNPTSDRTMTSTRRWDVKKSLYREVY